MSGPMEGLVPSGSTEFGVQFQFFIFQILEPLIWRTTTETVQEPNPQPNNTGHNQLQGLHVVPLVK